MDFKVALQNRNSVQGRRKYHSFFSFLLFHFTVFSSILHSLKKEGEEAAKESPGSCRREEI